MEEKNKKLFEKNCIIEKDGKKYLNECGQIIICFIAVSLARHIINELGLKEKKENGN